MSYRSHLIQRQRIAAQRAALLRQQRRNARYRYQQQYLSQLRAQQARLSRLNSYNYYNDPYFYTAPSYRYRYSGTWYNTNQYGVDLLRQAVNNGYQQGYYAGRADREDNWRFSYRDGFAYQDANYGYSGFYVDRNSYNYYFRQGYERGYEDGYYSRNRHGGIGVGGALAIAGAVLGTILVIDAIND